jgi:putative DNA primase/helicase
MSAAEIAASLGNAHREGRNWRCRCPLHNGTSLALCDGHRGLLVKCWAGCNGNEVLAELRRLGLLAGRSDGTPAASMPALSHDRVEAERRIGLAHRIWDSARDARGGPVVRYFADRGITLSPPPSVRWAPSLRRPDGAYGPAMVARVDNLDGELIGVHRTWLDHGSDGIWRRRDRASLGSIAGGAVRLAPAAQILMIGEGIETSLAAMHATGMPAWAALSTSGLVALALPPVVRAVIVLADHDASGAGERAARTAAARWLTEGRCVKLTMPPEPGSDFNDVLMSRAHAEMRDVAT